LILDDVILLLRGREKSFVSTFFCLGANDTESFRFHTQASSAFTPRQLVQKSPKLRDPLPNPLPRYRLSTMIEI
jgi:hypothetical protein